MSSGTAADASSYGEGVAYWALAEMVRMRCEIVEDEDPASALDQAPRHGRAGTSRMRRSAHWVEPRLAHLLGLEEGAPGDQENLFSAWRILFERLAEEAADDPRLRGHAVGRRWPA